MTSVINLNRPRKITINNNPRIVFFRNFTIYTTSSRQLPKQTQPRAHLYYIRLHDRVAVRDTEKKNKQIARATTTWRPSSRSLAAFASILVYIFPFFPSHVGRKHYSFSISLSLSLARVCALCHLALHVFLSGKLLWFIVSDTRLYYIRVYNCVCSSSGYFARDKWL